jgi:hypothetical protein
VGVVFIYSRDGSAFEFVESLGGGSPAADFGEDLALSGRTLLVGAPALLIRRVDIRDGAAFAYRFPPEDRHQADDDD